MKPAVTPASLVTTSGPPPRAVMLALWAVLLALSPLGRALHRAAGALFPDSIAYLGFASGLFRDGRLFLEGWGHVDTGLILPPLYPALIGAWARLGGDPILAAYGISTIAGLAALLPLALLAVRLSSPAFALLALALAQLHPFFLEYGAAPLTEMPFVLVLAGALLGALALPLSTRLWPAVLLGAAAGVLFLTRQIGGFLMPAMALVCFLAAFEGPGPALRRGALAALLVVAGFAAVMLPYAGALHAQSGQWPSVQSFRMDRYVVSGEAAAGAPAPVSSYEDLYAQRRAQRALTGDGAEMLGWVVRPASAAAPARPLNRVRRFFFFLRDNVVHLAASLGAPATGALALSLLTPLWGGGATLRRRWTLPIVLAAYLGALSLLTGIIARYVDVLVPFAYLQVFAEAHRLAVAALARRPRLAAPALAAGGVALAATLALTLPATYRSLPLAPRIGELGNPLEACRAAVTPGEPVFAFHAMGPYLLGATWRIVPNDGFDKLRRYAARTGVRYLLLTQLPPDRSERGYYDHAPWAADVRPLVARGDLASACATSDGVATLYLLRPAPP